MITLTPLAITKIKEFLAQREDASALRIAIIGSGCSGFQYRMTLESEAGADDKVFDLDGLKIFVDSKSMLYLTGTTVDYVEAKDGAGFAFDNPNSKTSCECGEDGCFQA